MCPGRPGVDDFDAAIGDVVAAGLDTDCNGATVGGSWGIQRDAIPSQWTAPWQGRVALSLAGHDEVSLEALVERTTRVVEALAEFELNRGVRSWSGFSRAAGSTMTSEVIAGLTSGAEH